MSVFKVTEEEREAIRKQHELAEKKEQERKDELKKGLQQPEKNDKDDRNL